MRTGPLPAFNEGRSASPPAQSFPVVASMVFAALGSQRPIAPKVMGYLGDRLRHSERAGRRPCLIQIVQGSFFVPRCSAVFGVQIAYAQYRRAIAR